MIIRELREDEAHKSDEVSAVAFNHPVDMKKARETKLTRRVIGAFLDDGETIMSKIEPLDLKTSFYGKFVGTLGIAGVATKPEYRRAGCVRAMFGYLFDSAEEKGWELSYLYPFSYSYYRKFGYERVCESFDIELPIRELDFAPMDTGVRLYRPEMKEDILSVYFAYGEDINCLVYPDDRMFPAHACDEPYGKNNYTYIWYSPDGTPGAYSTFIINGSVLTVKELIFTDSASLMGILGFLRTFDGQVKTIMFIKIPADSPLFSLIREFTNTTVTLKFNAMGRVLDVHRLLSRVSYNASGEFCVKVNDTVGKNKKIFEVQYGQGSASVNARDSGPYDAEVSIQTFTRIILGAQEPDLKKALFLPGFKAANKARAQAFLNAFPRRTVSMIDHF